jgi:hypothetical protein
MPDPRQPPEPRSLSGSHASLTPRAWGWRPITQQEGNTMKDYTLVPLTGSTGRQLVHGFRDAISIARDIAAREYTTVHVRNEADQLEWWVAFRVRGGRRGAYTTIEVTR